MKLFTLNEANEVLEQIMPMLFEMQTLHGEISGYKLGSRAAASASHFGGGMEGGTDYVNKLYQAGKIANDILEKGVELKDHSKGLIDFPSLRGDRTILLCWEIGDGEEIRWWHEIDAGYAGRQPL